LFRESDDTEKILVLVSDGAAADGDPEPICDNLK
jgi:Mg-chelatase subunit ChlD